MGNWKPLTLGRKRRQRVIVVEKRMRAVTEQKESVTRSETKFAKLTPNTLVSTTMYTLSPMYLLSFSAGIFTCLWKSAKQWSQIQQILHKLCNFIFSKSVFYALNNYSPQNCKKIQSNQWFFCLSIRQDEIYIIISAKNMKIWILQWIFCTVLWIPDNLYPL